MESFICVKPIGELKIDRVFFESYYPILFTCTDGNKNIYLVVSYFAHEKEKKWLLTKVDPKTIIRFLKDEITIRDAFLLPNEKKYKLISKNANYTLEEEDISMWNSPKNLNLPASNEYMDSDCGEFDEDIEHYESIINEDFLLREEHKVIFDTTNSFGIFVDDLFVLEPYNTYYSTKFQDKNRILIEIIQENIIIDTNYYNNTVSYNRNMSENQILYNETIVDIFSSSVKYSYNLSKCS